MGTSSTLQFAKREPPPCLGPRRGSRERSSLRARSAPPKKRSGRERGSCALTPAANSYRTLQRALADRLIPMRRRAVLVVPEAQCPHPRRADRIDVPTIGVVGDLRIDIKENRERLAFSRHQELLGKAKALDLVEVPADLERGHVVDRRAENRFIAQIDGCVFDLVLLPEPNLDRLRCVEASWKVRCYVGVESHRDRGTGNGARRRGCDLRRSSQSGGLAEIGDRAARSNKSALP
jgi:hypothetical protein